MSEIVVLKAHKMNEILPPGYSLDHDPVVAILRRAGGSVVVHFSMWSFQSLLVLEEAEMDLAQGGYVW